MKKTMNKYNDTRYEVHFTKKFKHNYKQIMKQGKNISKLNEVIKHLANKEELDSKYKDHALINNKYYNNCRECHIEPDWLLVYKYFDDKLILYLLETGSHSDLFK